MASAQVALGAKVSLQSLEGSPVFGEKSLEDVRHVRDYRSVPILGRLGFSRSMRDAIEKGGFDIVHTHGLWLVPNNYLPKDTSFVISPRGMLASVALGFSPLKKRVISLYCQQRTLNAARLFHATSQSEYHDIREYGLRQPVAVVPNGIDIPRVSERSESPERRRVISVGRIHKKKGLDRLIAAWATLETRYPNWDLEIIGPDQQGHRSELERLSRSLGLRRVFFSNAIHGDQKKEFMSTADLFILPSLSENFGMTVAESLAVAVPVIATIGTPWGGLETNRCGWWVGQSPVELAGALGQAMDLPSAELRAMGRRGRHWMKNEFSWAGIGEKTLQAYRWVLGFGDKPDFVRLD
jgi:glycosyltransferase involved in cell wall biosynthesis